MNTKNTTVLVTGISGYIAAHVTQRLLQRGFSVRGTVRTLSKSEAVIAGLTAAGVDTSRLSFVEADLNSDTGWDLAAKGCDYVQHLASPFPAEQPTDREALVPEARAGAQRVLAAGFAAGAKRIVMTSSMVAMMGQKNKGAHKVFGEDDWTDPEWNKLRAYDVSKTRAELSAWEFARVQGFEKQLTTVNPSLVLGPGIGGAYGASVGMIESMFKGDFPRTPKLAIPIVDVRDLADLHIAAMESENTGGRRLIGAGETLYLSEIASILRTTYPQKAKRLPKGDLPDFMVRLAALFDDRIKSVLSSLGTFHEADTTYVTELTGITFRSAKESILDTAAYLDDLGKLD